MERNDDDMMQNTKQQYSKRHNKDDSILKWYIFCVKFCTGQMNIDTMMTSVTKLCQDFLFLQSNFAKYFLLLHVLFLLVNTVLVVGASSSSSSSSSSSIHNSYHHQNQQRYCHSHPLTRQVRQEQQVLLSNILRRAIAPIANIHSLYPALELSSRLSKSENSAIVVLVSNPTTSNNNLGNHEEFPLSSSESSVFSETATTAATTNPMLSREYDDTSAITMTSEPVSSSSFSLTQSASYGERTRDAKFPDINAIRASSATLAGEMPSWGETFYLGADDDIRRNPRRRPPPEFLPTRSKSATIVAQLLQFQQPLGTLLRWQKKLLSSMSGTITTGSATTQDAQTGESVGKATSPSVWKSKSLPYDSLIPAPDWRYFSSCTTNPGGDPSTTSSRDASRHTSDSNNERIHWISDGPIHASVIHTKHKSNEDNHSEQDMTSTLPFASIDASDAVSLTLFVWTATKMFLGRAVFGTLLTVLPLYIGQKLAQTFVLLPLQDWYTGRYLRLTYVTLEQQYRIAYFRIFPAVRRSIGRIAVHMFLLFGIGRIAKAIIGLQRPPCQHPTFGGCYWWCGIVWLGTVIGIGHAASSATAIWGPLKLQLLPDDDYDDHLFFTNNSNKNRDLTGTPSIMTFTGRKNTINSSNSNGIKTNNNPTFKNLENRPQLGRFVRQPWTLVYFLFDPDQWFREIVANHRRKQQRSMLSRRRAATFDADPILFPATWSIVRMLQMMAVAKELHTSGDSMHFFLRWVLIEQAMSDEWYRVFMCENRIGLGMVIMVGYMYSVMNLLWKIIGSKSVPNISSVSTLLMLPSVLAIIVSAWMNVLVYFNRDFVTVRRKPNASTNTASSSHQGKTSHKRRPQIEQRIKKPRQTEESDNNNQQTHQSSPMKAIASSSMHSINSKHVSSEPKIINLFAKNY